MYFNVHGIQTYSTWFLCCFLLLFSISGASLLHRHWSRPISHGLGREFQVQCTTSWSWDLELRFLDLFFQSEILFSDVSFTDFDLEVKRTWRKMLKIQHSCNLQRCRDLQRPIGECRCCCCRRWWWWWWWFVFRLQRNSLCCSNQPETSQAPGRLHHQHIYFDEMRP